MFRTYNFIKKDYYNRFIDDEKCIIFHFLLLFNFNLTNIYYNYIEGDIMRILIVEDEYNLADIVATRLKKEK